MQLDHVQLAIPAGGEAACRAFWGDVLGFDELRKPAALAARGGAWFRAGTAELHLGVAAAFCPATKAHPAFATSELDAVAARLVRAGHPVRWDDTIPERRRFFTDDPFGNRVEFVAPGACTEAQ